MSFWDNPVQSVTDTVSQIGQTLANPAAAKPSDVFIAAGDPLGGAVTRAIDANPTTAAIATAAAGVATSAWGGVGAAAFAKGVQLQNGVTSSGSSVQVNGSGYYPAMPANMYSAQVQPQQMYSQAATRAANSSQAGTNQLSKYAWPVLIGVGLVALLRS